MNKTKPGRPPIPADQKKKPNPTLQIRLTEHQKDLYRSNLGRDRLIALLELSESDPAEFGGVMDKLDNINERTSKEGNKNG